jgi:LemA protein
MKSFFGWLPLTLVMLIGVGIFCAIKLAPWHNTFVNLSEDVQKEWAQVDALLQRRYDLIPQLEATVKGFSEQEREIYLGLANARRDYGDAKTINGKIKASHRAEGYLSRLLFAGRVHPNLKSDQTFLSLMGSLERTENDIARQRMAYNEAVNRLNKVVKSFEGQLVGMVLDVQVAAYYDPANAAKTAPGLDFRAGSEAVTPTKEGVKLPPQGATAYNLKFNGTVKADDGTIRALVVLHNGQTRVVAPGDDIPEMGAKVLQITDDGVVFEKRTVEGTSRITLTRDGVQ